MKSWPGAYFFLILLLHVILRGDCNNLEEKKKQSVFLCVMTIGYSIAILFYLISLCMHSISVILAPAAAAGALKCRNSLAFIMINVGRPRRVINSQEFGSQ